VPLLVALAAVVLELLVVALLVVLELLVVLAAVVLELLVAVLPPPAPPVLLALPPVAAALLLELLPPWPSSGVAASSEQPSWMAPTAPITNSKVKADFIPDLISLPLVPAS
jgi:hypothetical protein